MQPQKQNIKSLKRLLIHKLNIYIHVTAWHVCIYKVIRHAMNGVKTMLKLFKIILVILFFVYVYQCTYTQKHNDMLQHINHDMVTRCTHDLVQYCD